MAYLPHDRDALAKTDLSLANNGSFLARRQRKLAEISASSANNSILSTSILGSSLNASAALTNISTNKTPSKSPRKTPGKVRGKTPRTTPVGGNGGDRFIPNRRAMDFSLANYALTRREQDENHEDESYRAAVGEQLNVDLPNFRIMRYGDKAPPAPQGHAGNRILYSASKPPVSSKKNSRFIPKVAERVLDAPDIRDDFYLNPIDWSSGNQLSVCLGGEVYLWNAATGTVDQLLQLPSPSAYVCSVSWSADGVYLALGTSEHQVQLWDVRQRKLLRTLSSHSSRVGSLSWNGHVLSSGSRSGQLHHSDVRVAEHHVGSIAAHQQEVCGLKWSPDGAMLASGGNDNLLQVWPNAMSHGAVQPLHTFTEHQAAVKAIAWCPWQSSLLASGGGTADRSIRFWSCNLGTQLNTIDTNSQVSALLWSEEHKEIISAHGFTKNELIIWKYPSMKKVAELMGHTMRVLDMCLSSDGSRVASVAADETLRIWNCFEVDPSKKKQRKQPNTSISTAFGQSIR